MPQARTPAQEIQASCDAIVRTATITEADCDALAVACIAGEAAIGDTLWRSRGYDTALNSINAAAVALGLATNINE